MTMIPVVVVESHQHALEHIHYVLRQKNNQHLLRTGSNNTLSSSSSNSSSSRSSGGGGGGWSMVHFDAHPDLACPNSKIPAAACFLPHKTWSGSNSSSKKEQQQQTTMCNNNGARNCHSIATNDVSQADDGEDVVVDEDVDAHDNDNHHQNEKNLYELLDSSTSGIAEWILPLVLAANLKFVHWIVPSRTFESRSISKHPACSEVPSATNIFSGNNRSSINEKKESFHLPPQQLPIGSHQYNVGAWIPPPPTHHPRSSSTTTTTAGIVDPTNKCDVELFLDLPTNATVKVDWNHPYYLEDDAVVSTNELMLPQKMDLKVSMLQQREPPSAAAAASTNKKNDGHKSDEILYAADDNQNKNWALDICLDYFAYLNPFVTDLVKMDLQFTTAYITCVQKSTIYRAQQYSKQIQKEERHSKDFNHHRSEVILFQEYFTTFLKNALSTMINGNYCDKIIEMTRNINDESVIVSMAKETSLCIFQDIGIIESEQTACNKQLLPTSSLSSMLRKCYDSKEIGRAALLELIVFLVLHAVKYQNNDDNFHANNSHKHEINNKNLQQQKQHQFRCNSNRHNRWETLIQTALEALPTLLCMPHNNNFIPISTNDENYQSPSTSKVSSLHTPVKSANRNDGNKELIGDEYNSHQHCTNIPCTSTNSGYCGMYSKDAHDDFDMQKIKKEHQLLYEELIIDLSLKQVEEELLARRRHRCYNHLEENNDSGDIQEVSLSSLPFIITVSRSSDDGFTPSHVVEYLQFRVLKMVHSIYCRCHNRAHFINPDVVVCSDDEGSDDHSSAASKSNSSSHGCGNDISRNSSTLRNDLDVSSPQSTSSCCNFNIVFDYGKWEGSTISS